MATQVTQPDPTVIAKPSARTVVMRPDGAVRQFAADLEKVSSVMMQTQALGLKMVEMSQALAKVEPALAQAAENLAATQKRLEVTAQRVLAAAEIMEFAQRESVESLGRRMQTLVGLTYWALGLGSCAMAGSIVAVIAHYLMAH